MSASETNTSSAATAPTRLPTQNKGAALGLPDHPDREAAISEAHARPPLPLTVPAVLHHLAFTANERESAALFEKLFHETTDDVRRHTIRNRDGLVVKWERHTEFVSLTMLGRDDGSKAETLIRTLQSNWPDGVKLLVAIRAFIVDRGKASDLAERDTIGGQLRGDIMIASTFMPGPEGYIDIQFFCANVGPAQLGRRVQRVLEAETYRTMAVLGLPLARRVGPQLTALENALTEVTANMTNHEGSAEEVLEAIQTLSAKIEALRASTRFRFSASRAYATLVEERLDSLGEGKLGERLTFSGFIRTRLNPAARTIVSAEDRMAELSASVGRALNLLRARVDVSQNRANQSILHSMNERQHRQLLLSEAVESLSVIAISYYLLGIVSYPVRTLVDTGIIPVSQTVALGILAPFVAFSVFAVLRRVRKRIVKDK